MTASVLRLPTFFLLAASLSASGGLRAQPPSAAPQSSLPPTADISDSAPLPSSILAPALTQLRQALAILRPEKWKTPGPVTQETTGNISSIERDLDTTLPGLLATADRNPASVAEVLPAYRNVEALYDVLLRVTLVANLVAPDPQSTALQRATGTLEDARRALGDRIQSSSVSQTRAITTLQTQLRAAQTSPAPVAASSACPLTPAAPVKKRPAAKPRTSALQ